MTHRNSPAPDCEANAALSPRRGHVLTAAIVFTAFAIYGSLVYFEYRPMSFTEAVRRFQNIPAPEFGTKHRADWAANILLFVPLGFCWLGAVCLDRRKRWLWFAAPLVVIACIVLSMAIEFSQLWFPKRTVSQSDIIAEGIGCGIGVVVWIIAGQGLVDWLRSTVHKPKPGSAVLQLLNVYTIGFFIASLLPLDLTLTLSELYDKFKSGRVSWIPFSHDYGSPIEWFYAITIDIIVWIPIGAWLVLFLMHRNHARPSRGLVLLAGAAMILAVEIAQLFVLSRFSSTTDLVTGLVGLSIGAEIVQRWLVRNRNGSLQPALQVGIARFRPSLCWAAAVAVYSVFLVLLLWHPLDFRWDAKFAKPRLAGFFRPPLESLHRGSEFKAITEVIRKTMFFAPLGAGLLMVAAKLPAPRVVRRVTAWIGLLIAMVLAVGIELGQVVLPSHTPDISDAMICTLGALMGMLVAAWLLRANRQPSEGSANSENSSRKALGNQRQPTTP